MVHDGWYKVDFGLFTYTLLCNYEHYPINQLIRKNNTKYIQSPSK